MALNCMVVDDDELARLMIRKYVENTSYSINAALKSGKSVLLEGAQGSLLDVVHGTRPFVTSSNTTSGGAAANLGINLRKFRIT